MAADVVPAALQTQPRSEAGDFMLLRLKAAEKDEHYDPVVEIIPPLLPIIYIR